MTAPGADALRDQIEAAAHRPMKRIEASCSFASLGRADGDIVRS